MTSYADFRTGLSYRGVLAMLWSASDDTSTWRYRGRSGVLGFWRELKLEMFEVYERTNDAEHARRSVLRRYSMRGTATFLRRLRMARRRARPETAGEFFDSKRRELVPGSKGVARNASLCDSQGMTTKHRAPEGNAQLMVDGDCTPMVGWTVATLAGTVILTAESAPSGYEVKIFLSASDAREIAKALRGAL